MRYVLAARLMWLMWHEAVSANVLTTKSITANVQLAVN